MIPPLGTLRLEPATLLLLPPVTLPTGVGTATLTLQVLAHSGLIGVPFYVQAVVLDLLEPARSTNLWVDVIDGH